MNRTTAARSSAANRSAFWRYVLSPLRHLAIRGLQRSRTAPPPLLEFGMTVSGRPVRGARWGFGPQPVVYLLSGRRGRSASSGALVRALLAADYGVVTLDAPADVVDLALAPVGTRHGSPAAVIDLTDPDADQTVSRLLAGRRPPS